mgnify:CR=1 FL=1
MSDEFLSQEELDALLSGLTSGSTDSISVDEEISSLADAIIEGFSTALNTMIGRNVTITKEELERANAVNLADRLSPHLVVSMVELTWKDNKVDLLFFMEDNLGSTLADLMVGGTGEGTPPLDEIRMSALNEVISQMMGSATTSISKVFSAPVNMEPPATQTINLEEDKEKLKELIEPTKTVSFGSYTVKLDEKDVGKLFLVLPARLAGEESKTETPSGVGRQTESQPVPIAKQEKPVKATPVEFEELQPRAMSQQDTGKLELLLDVPLTISVELGRTKMTLKQVLELYNGSIIELDKLTGEPVDVLVNGKIVARGEVVVVDENFAVRITEIVSPRERLTTLR